MDRSKEKGFGRRALTVPVTKYGNRKTEAFGIVFDSKREADRYLELRLLERAGEITELQRQVPFELIPPQKFRGKKIRAVSYIADFTYRDRDENLVVEDAKGYRKGAGYEVYNIKKKLMLYRHGIMVREV